MADFLAFAGAGLGVFCWYQLVACMKKNGRSALLRHLIGVLFGPLAMGGLGMTLFSLAGGVDAQGDTWGAAGVIAGLVLSAPLLVPLLFSWRKARQHPGGESLVVREFLEDVQQAAEEAPLEKAAMAAPKPSPEPSPKASWSSVYAEPLRFVYEDASGKVTTREVSAWRVSGDRLRGHCHERGMVRTFRLDRIVEVLEGAVALGEARRAPLQEPAAPLPDRRGAGAPEIHFSGFDEQTRHTLEKTAASHGFKVRKSVTKNLDFFCRGQRPSQEKLAKAETKPGCTVIDRDGFLWMVATGEIKT
jgi:hypothetical protein